MFNIKKIAAGFKTPGDGTPGHVSKVVLNAQRKAADYLNHKTAGWSPLKTKILLIVFCLVTGNTCLYLIGKAVLSANGPPIVKIQRLAVPSLKRPYPLADSISSIHH